MWIRYISDVHLFGVAPFYTLEELVFLITSSPYPVVLNGDIVDIANCKTKELPEAYQTLILLVALVKKHNGYFIRGNHECDAVDEADELLICNYILATHGDKAMWSIEKWRKFRAQSKGAGWIKRNLISKPISTLRHLRTVRPNNTFKAWITEAKKRYPEIKYIFVGHTHAPEMIRFTQDEVESIMFPQGKTDINLKI